MLIFIHKHSTHHANALHGQKSRVINHVSCQILPAPTTLHQTKKNACSCKQEVISRVNNTGCQGLLLMFSENGFLMKSWRTKLN